MLLLPQGVWPVQAASSVQFLWLSDIHFNPLADPALVDKLAAADPAQWTPILAASSTTGLSQFGQDPNWPLFSSALAAAKTARHEFAFTIVTGDLLVHHFREQFDLSASVHDDAAFRQFLRKSVEFVALQLKQISPGAPVIVSLGNNDDECGDYLIQPNGPFLEDSAGIVSGLAGIPADSSFAGSWSATGSYGMKHPTLQHYRIVVLDTVFFSPRYRSGCGQVAGDPGEALLKWLGDNLEDARKQQEKVWLIYHIPPGIDGYGSAHPKQPVASNGPTLLWKAQYTSEFTALLERYREVVELSFAGHTHADDFRLMDRSLVIIGPGLTPITQQSPAFRIVTLNPNGELEDQSTYYLSNLATAGATDWKLEYSFNSAWSLRGLNFANYQKLYRQIETSPETRERWTRFYSASHPEGGAVTPANFLAFHCASGNTNISDYQACLSPAR